MRQSTSRAPSSSLIRVEVDGGQVAGPTASSKPGTALGIGLGSTTNTSKLRLIVSPAVLTPGAVRFRIPLSPVVLTDQLARPGETAETHNRRFVVTGSAVTDAVPSPLWSARATAIPVSRASIKDRCSTIIDTTEWVHVHAVSRPSAAVAAAVSSRTAWPPGGNSDSSPSGRGSVTVTRYLRIGQGRSGSSVYS